MSTNLDIAVMSDYDLRRAIAECVWFHAKQLDNGRYQIWRGGWGCVGCSEQSFETADMAWASALVANDIPLYATDASVILEVLCGVCFEMGWSFGYDGQPNPPAFVLRDTDGTELVHVESFASTGHTRRLAELSLLALRAMQKVRRPRIERG